MPQNDIFDDRNEPFAVLRVFIADAVEFGRLRNVRLSAGAIIGMVVNNIMVDVLAFKVSNRIWSITPFKPTA